jgi:hypothetical protein
MAMPTNPQDTCLRNCRLIVAHSASVTQAKDAVEVLRTPSPKVSRYGDTIPGGCMGDKAGEWAPLSLRHTIFRKSGSVADLVATAAIQLTLIDTAAETRPFRVGGAGHCHVRGPVG